MRNLTNLIYQADVMTGVPRAIVTDTKNRGLHSLQSIASRAFEAGKKICDPSNNIYEISLSEISGKTWQTVFARIGLLMSEVQATETQELYQVLSLQNISSVAAIELGLNSKQTETALKLFWSLSEYSHWATVADRTLFSGRDFIFSAAYFKQMQKLDIRLAPEYQKLTISFYSYPERVYESAVIMDNYLAGVESQLGFPLRRWFYEHQDSILEIKKQEQQIGLRKLTHSNHPELNEPNKVEFTRKTIINELLPAAGIEPEKRQAAADFILNLPSGGLNKIYDLILSFAKKEDLNPHTLRACYVVYCNGRNRTAEYSRISIRALRALHDQRLLGAKKTTDTRKATDTVKLPETAKKTEVVNSLIKSSEITAEVLFFALCSLGLEQNNRKAYLDFGERIIKIKDSANSSARSSPLETVKTLVGLAEEQSDKMPYDQLFKQRFTELLKQLCYRHYNSDIKQILKELERCKKVSEATSNSRSEQIVSNLLKDIIPGLIKLFNQIELYKAPKSIKVKLLKEQIEGVVAALNFEKLLLLYGTGTGKTEVGATYCESLATGRILWTTKASNVYATASRLKTKVLDKQSAKVLALDSSLKDLTLDEFRNLLTKNHYVVTGYDYLRHLRKSNPEKYRILQDWVRKGIRVLDEVQVLDNPKSDRSITIQGLKAEKTICLSATPFQHRPERIATIFHLCFTDKYPDPVRLIKHLRQNKGFIKDLIDLHSTIYNIQDLGRFFEDSDKISLAQQITADTPRIPRLQVKRKKFMLSEQHSQLYVELATNYRDYALQNGLKQNAVCQVAMLQRLIQDPESLGSGAPFALISAAKEIALPALEKGEKVIFFGYRPKTLKMLAQDPEIRKYGLVLLTGQQTPKERSVALEMLEEDPDILCAAIQPVAAGSGHNCRSVSHVIVIDSDRRWLIADRIQALGRPIRLLFPGDERFAKMGVSVTILEPELQPSAITAVEDPRAKKILSKGSIYSQWLDRDQAALEEFYYYTARGQKTVKLPTPKSAEQLISLLNQRLDRVPDAKIRTVFSDKQRSPLNLHNNHIKNAWRELGLKEFLKSEIQALGKDPSDLRVAHFAGAEALEIPCYLELGIVPQNIIGFGLGTATEKEYCRANVLRQGAQFIGSRAQDILPYSDSKFDIISIDPEGYLTNSLASTIMQLRLSEHAILIKNSLQARERENDKNLIYAAGGRRSNLDTILIKLCATNPANAENATAAIRHARQVSRLSRQIADTLSEKMHLEKQSLADLIAEAYLGSWHTKSFSQLRYNSDGGSPFLSTFCRIQQWQESVRNQSALTGLRSFMQKILEKHNIPAGHTPADYLSVLSSSSTIILRHKTAGILKLSRSELEAILAYFIQAVSAKHRLKELLNYDIPVLQLLD